MGAGRQGTLERHFASLGLSFPIWLCVHSFIQQTFPEFIYWKQLEDGTWLWPRLPASAPSTEWALVENKVTGSMALL